MIEKYLTVGTIVKLFGSDKKLMIAGFYCTSQKNGKAYDYCGFFYPEGFVGKNNVIMFNHEQISEVCDRGFAEDIEAKKFNEFLVEKLKSK